MTVGNIAMMKDNDEVKVFKISLARKKLNVTLGKILFLKK